MKSQIGVTEILLIVGSIAISSLLFTTLVSEVKEWSYFLDISSAESIAKDIASLISASGVSPLNITIHHQLENSYDVFIKERLVNATLSKEVFGEALIKVENVTAKIPIDVSVEMSNVKKIEIEKFVEKGKNKHAVRKVE